MFLDRRAVLAGLVALALWAGPARAQADEHADVPVVAVASSLRFAMADVVRAFTDDTGLVVKLSFGSSGNLSRQIREGAPFQMFLAADEQFILDLHDDGLTPDAGDVYAVGRIVIVAPNGSPLTPDANMDALATLLAAGRITGFAIANPDHAPYGMRAREALIARGLWDDLQPALILGENVSQAAQFALSGNAEGGIIAYALALAPEVAPRGHYALIPEDWHTPLRQRMVLLNGAGDVARAFYTYLNAPAARAILSRYGFTVPTGG